MYFRKGLSESVSQTINEISNIYLSYLELTTLGESILLGFLGDSNVKESAYNAGNPCLNPRLRRYPGEGNGNPLQYSYLENSVDRRVWWAAVHGVAQSPTRLKWLSMQARTGEGNGNPLQFSCLENPRDRGAWYAAIYGVSQSWTWLKRLSSSGQYSCLKNPVDRRAWRATVHGVSKSRTWLSN